MNTSTRTSSLAGLLGCRSLILCSLLAYPGIAFSQEPDITPPQNGEVIPAGPREVIKETVIQKEDHTLTVREVVPPQAVVRPNPVPAPVQPQNESTLPKRFIMATASRFAGKATLLEWWMGGEKFQAWSPVDFRHLDGAVEFEDRGTRFSVMFLVAARSVPQGAANELTAREQMIVAGPTNEALGNQPLLVAGSQSNGGAMDFLYGVHDHYNQNRVALTAAYQARVQQRLNPPPPPQPQPRPDKTVNYWKYHQSTQNQDR